MTMVTFVDSAGRAYPTVAAPGQSLMQIALDHDVPGILAECGGSCTCGTCHVYIEAPWNRLLPAPSESESFLLEIVLEPKPFSRLACQLKLNANLDGLIVRLPKEQL
jgi:ferredoxin, 2Fe-2S